MATTPTAAPPGYHTVTPCLIVDNAADAIAFYRNAFDAQEAMRLEHAGRILHAEIRLGDSTIMLGETTPDGMYRSPTSLGGTPVTLMVYVADADAIFNQALAAGARAIQPMTDHFYGDRMGKLADPFGHIWNIGTRKEEVSPDEMQRRLDELMAAQPGA
jgi:PhnB protein